MDTLKFGLPGKLDIFHSFMCHFLSPPHPTEYFALQMRANEHAVCGFATSVLRSGRKYIIRRLWPRQVEVVKTRQETVAFVRLSRAEFPAKSPRSLRYISGTQNLLGSDWLYRTHGDCLQITSKIWIWIVNTAKLIFIATCSWKLHKSRENERNMNYGHKWS